MHAEIGRSGVVWCDRKMLEKLKGKMYRTECKANIDV